MGEAKKKAEALREWRGGQTADEQTIADVALKLFDVFVRPLEAMAMCYRLTFFLAEYLQDRHAISVDAVVGYINDGTGDLMASHAWVESCGKRVDLAPAFTEHPTAQLPGEVVVLDRVVRAGTRYSYHRERSPEALKAILDLNSDPIFAALAQHKEEEHLTMTARSQNAALRLAYLNAAPDGFDYARLAAMVEGT